jgi:g-D-glutamyl-meso-diaminopimelate peptidase
MIEKNHLYWGDCMRTLREGMFGSDVMEVQSVLKRAGYTSAPVDGLFGPQTREAVVEFQRRFGFAQDGVIGSATWKVLNRFLLGNDLYTVRRGDTLYEIARKYGTSMQALRTANPQLNPENLIPGRRIIVPYSFDVVPTDTDFTYEVLTHVIQGLKARYPFLEVTNSGSSVLGKTLYTLRLGKGSNQVFYNAAHHALEWITTPVLMKFAEDFLRAYAYGENLFGYDINAMWNQSSIYLMPMINPDGVDLVINGLQTGNPYGGELVRWNDGSTDFSQNWEANIRGVDLNHNYDAGWLLGKEAAEELGITGPGPTRYPGPYPLSEPESRAVVRFTQNHNFRLVLAYHSQGRVIYWNFMDMAPQEAKVIGERMSEITGYALEEAAGVTSYSGYKDWFTQEYRRPGYTVEVGQGTNPLPISQFDTIYSTNLPLLLYTSTV